MLSLFGDPMHSTASDPSPLTDEILLQQLGAATMLCWHQLPPKAQTTILNQANDMIGLTPIPNLRSEIVRLLLWRQQPNRHGR
jgi:hypothetical protein